MANNLYDIYEIFYECQNENEVYQRVEELVKMGYNYFDIFTFRYNGSDGKYHREVYVFKDSKKEG